MWPFVGFCFISASIPPVSGISYPPPHSPGNPDRTDSNLHSHPEPKMGRDPGLQVSDSFWRGHRIQITPMSSAPKTWEALFLLCGYNRTVVLPGLLGTKLTGRKVGSEALRSGSTIRAPRSSLSDPASLGPFNHVITNSFVVVTVCLS